MSTYVYHLSNKDQWDSSTLPLCNLLGNTMKMVLKILRFEWIPFPNIITCTIIRALRSLLNVSYVYNEWTFFFFNKVFFFSWFVFVFLVWEWNVVIMLTIEKYFVFEYWWCLWPVKSCWIHLQVVPSQVSLFCGTYGNVWHI